MKTKIFIDGQEGTTGLQLRERLANRTDLEIITISEPLRKVSSERAKCINQSDFTFLCLPDDAAREAVALAEPGNPVRILDASTAHRTHPDWAYGFPELSAAHRKKIISSSRVAVPGCYASGFNALCYPLVQSGALAPYHPVICYAVSGYSGAGKKAIAAYESPERPKDWSSPRWYALSMRHKHLPEMMAVSGLSYKPLFNPIVDDYYNGMVVCIPLINRTLAKRIDAKGIHDILSEQYAGQRFVQVTPFGGETVLPDGFMASCSLAGTNDMQIFVFGNEEQTLLAARFDNLGKGASGAAVQCMNIMMGIDEATGLL